MFHVSNCFSIHLGLQLEPVDEFITYANYSPSRAKSKEIFSLCLQSVFCHSWSFHFSCTTSTSFAVCKLHCLEMELRMEIEVELEMDMKGH